MAFFALQMDETEELHRRIANLNDLLQQRDAMLNDINASLQDALSVLSVVLQMTWPTHFCRPTKNITTKRRFLSDGCTVVRVLHAPIFLPHDIFCRNGGKTDGGASCAARQGRSVCRHLVCMSLSSGSRVSLSLSLLILSCKLLLT